MSAPQKYQLRSVTDVPEWLKEKVQVTIIMNHVLKISCDLLQCNFVSDTSNKYKTKVKLLFLYQLHQMSTRQL